MENIVIYSLLWLNIISLLIGYLLGNLNLKQKSNIVNSSFIKNNSNKTINHCSNIKIDDKKVVVSIDTDGLEKKYNQLGDIKTSQENISSSIDKLKHLKK